MIEKKLPSGNVLEISTLSMLKAYKVSQEAIEIISTMDIDLGETKLSRDDIKKIFATDILKFGQTIMQVFANDKLVDLAHQCFERCTYNGLRLTTNPETIEETFGDEFGDYPIAMAYVLIENIKPFMKSLGSFLPKSDKKKMKGRGRK